MNDKHLIELIDVSKDYAGDVALEHVNLYIKDGEFLTLLGPSGCGKTTMLRLIAGFIQPTAGRIEMDGVDIANVPPYKRRINTVFQKYALFPHLNVFDNIAFGLKIRKMDKKTIEEKVNAMLELVNLRGYGKRSFLFDYELQGRNGKGLKTFDFKKNGANGSSLAAVFHVREPFVFRIVQRHGAETPLSTEQVRIEARASRGSMLVAVVLDDDVVAVEREQG